MRVFAIAFSFFILFSLQYEEVLSLPQKMKLRLRNRSLFQKSDIQTKQSDTIARNLAVNEIVAVNPLFKTVFSWLGPLCFIGLQISSVSTAMKIVEKKSVGKFSPIPFASLFTNCIIWTLYGFLKLDKTILLPNGLGVLVSIYCLWAYHTNTINKPLREYYIVTFICAICFLLANFQQDQMIGLIGCALSIILSGSPLAVVKTVIKEKSTAALPFWTSLVTWINNFSWICYGYFIANDKLIYLPNLLGFTLSSIQMLLFLKYPSIPTLHKDIISKPILDA